MPKPASTTTSTAALTQLPSVLGHFATTLIRNATLPTIVPILAEPTTCRKEAFGLIGVTTRRLGSPG
jgi:hypothetical protein